MKNFTYILFIFILSFLCVCKSERKPNKKEFKEMKVESIAFKAGEYIPIKHTCDGEDISPEISWKEVPEEVKSLILICDDPDAPLKTWVHWVIYNIPPGMGKLNENVKLLKTLENGILQGKNDFGKIGYGGPCPPRGATHHYYFKLYGLDIKLDVEAGISKRELLKEMEGHIIAKGEIVGLYKRK